MNLGEVEGIDQMSSTNANMERLNAACSKRNEFNSCPPAVRAAQQAADDEFEQVRATSLSIGQNTMSWDAAILGTRVLTSPEGFMPESARDVQPHRGVER